MKRLPRPLAPALAASLLLASTALLSGARAESAPAPSAPPAAIAEALPVLKAAPAWRLTALDGKEIGAESLKGKVVVVDFWATWCGPCVHEIPGYVALQKKYAERGLVIVGLSLDQGGEAPVKAFAKRIGINYPLALATPEIVSAFGDIEAIPTTFLIDREGRIRHRKVGAMESEDYEKLLAPLL